ncbi:hypothetical protein [Oceanobacter mangrovi]|uniref:hypothetical protein n=1 Tax=Oceanobacter mangrovi TaxID=2862510 RepID=UPI001C8DC712|nr:hypothetical protein [Oceanobacter mangrovi]
MKSLALWAMRSRTQAIIAAAGLIAVPLLFWLGAAVLALVVLRQPTREATTVAMWGVMPSLAWLAMGDPTPFLVAVGVVLTALVLKQTMRLPLALMVAAVLGEIIYFCLPWLLADVLPLVVKQSETLVSKALENSPDLQATLLPLVAPMVHGVLAALHTLVICLCLLLGRYWQSSQDHPGGFGTEFRQLKLPLAFGAPVMLAVFLAAELSPLLAGMVPVLTVIMALAGLAVFHGVVFNSQASPNWLLPVYLALFVFGPYMYTLLIFVAALDSLIDIRTRLKDTAGQ